MKSSLSRRKFIGLSGGALASSSLLTTLSGFQRALAVTPDNSDYKALVCVFMFGGNDGFNWLVPNPATLTGSDPYSVYSRSRSNLALARNSLLPLNGTASDGSAYGLHPSCPEIQTLFNNGNAAFLCNVGTLVRPTTAAQAKAGSVTLPSQLFSHIDQQTLWMTSTSNSLERYGWAGRVADFYDANGYSSSLPMNINVGDTNYWQEGRRTIPYGMGIDGAPVMNVTNNSAYYRSGTRQNAATALLSQATQDSNLLVSEYAAVQLGAAGKVSLVNNALAGGDLSTQFGSWPGDGDLGKQLHQVARCIKARANFSSSRQIFFVGMGGFDTHNGLLNTQAALLGYLSKHLKSFWDSMSELGVQNKVTLFTASDFGRSLGSNGDGTDHAWGNHHLIMGGTVSGGRYYGTMPSLAIGGADDVGNGRVVPSTSTDQFASTLCRWFGIADSDLNSIFPNLANFGTRNLGFMV